MGVSSATGSAFGPFDAGEAGMVLNRFFASVTGPCPATVLVDAGVGRTERGVAVTELLADPVRGVLVVLVGLDGV